MKNRRLLDIVINSVIVGLLLTFCSQIHVLAQKQGINNTVFPTTKEISETNARLPVLVGEGTMWTKVEYDNEAKIQRFYYRFTEDVNKQAIRVAQSQGKERMKNALKQSPRSMARINAGMTYLYMYYSNTHEKLYEIRINKNDFSSGEIRGNQNEFISQSSGKNGSIKSELDKAEKAYLKNNYVVAEKYCIKALNKQDSDWRSELILYLINKTPDYLKRYLQKNTAIEPFNFAGSVYSYEEMINEYADQCYFAIKRKSSSPATKKSYCRQLEEMAAIALEHQPHNIRLLKILSFSLCMAKEYSKSESYAALLTKESEEEGSFAYGYIYSQEGRISLAKKAYQSALTINPNNGSALWNLANLYYSSRMGVPYEMRDNHDFQKSLNLRIQAAKCGLTQAIEWCKTNHVDW